ncbi:MAG: ABC transporter ATP-binding protein [Planctomycetota bacterium]|nr:ABC transporter ATP-binding protein [Planctomycetota bacterium]
MSELLLDLEGVCKGYEAPEGGAPVFVLNQLDLKVAPGESVAIIGPSGSGKSTLLNIIGTLDRPTSGKAVFDGQDLLAMDEAGLADVRNRKIGFVFQSHHLLPQCSVLENVLVPTLASDDPALRQGAEDRARKLLDKVGLGGRLSHKPAQLSGGERQRTAVVRALINRPKLLLADEPTGALDRGTSEHLAQLLVDLNKELGVTLILVTHAIPLAERMSRLLELRDGKLAVARPPETKA